MVTNLKSRDVTRKVERELWARAAGRCEFQGCNRPLYLSPVTSEALHIAEKAHIYSFSKNGPRGWGPFSTKSKEINCPSNLLLVCHHCHELVDNNPDRYSADLLIEWKKSHEYRIWTVAGICPNKASQVVLYGANIGGEKSFLQTWAAKQSMFPERYPAEERAVELGMNWEGKDDRSDYWQTEEMNLVQSFDRRVRPLIKDGVHFSVFALAPIPLLIRLGSLYTDKVAISVYQLLREPEQTWGWDDESPNIEYCINRPNEILGPPVLIISLSATVRHDRVRSIVGAKATLWELTIPEPHNDFLRSKQHLSAFRCTARRLISEIITAHGNDTPLRIFPAMPVSASVELGRIRMPKADMPWIIYDQNTDCKKFIEALII